MDLRKIPMMVDSQTAIFHNIHFRTSLHTHFYKIREQLGKGDQY